MEVQRLAGADNQLYFILLYTNLGASSTTLNAYALYCNIYIYIYKSRMANVVCAVQ